MNAYDTDAVESTDTNHDLDARDVRALTEYLTVLEDYGRARGAADLYMVVSQSGKEYLVDARTGACECPDATHRAPEGGCKHARRVAFATGERTIPAWVDRSAVDDQLGMHVAGTPRVAATDGGTIVDAGDEGEVIDEDDRPEECDCSPRVEELPCFPCWMAGFETPNPDVSPR